MDNKGKVLNLFKYVKELYAQRYHVVSDIKDQEWYRFVDSIPNDSENIMMNWLDRTENEDDAMSSTSSVFILKSLSLFSHAQDFLDAANTYKINVLYLIAHARIESNNGTSELAKGAYVAATTEIIIPMW